MASLRDIRKRIASVKNTQKITNAMKMVSAAKLRRAEEAIKAVPQEYREVCFSLGMSQWQTITRIVLPSALPGITTGIMLSVGRSLGETAVLLFTAGSALRMPASLFDSGRTMVGFHLLVRVPNCPFRYRKRLCFFQ